MNIKNKSMVNLTMNISDKPTVNFTTEHNR